MADTLTIPTSRLAYFIAHGKNLGARTIPRKSEGNSRTQLHGFLNAFAYRCTGAEEFKRLSVHDECGKRQGCYGVVLVENPDGSLRYPVDADTVPFNPLPVAPVAPAAMPAAVVSVSLPSAPGNPPVRYAPPEDSPTGRIRAVLASALPMRASNIATQLYMTVEAVKAIVADPASGITVKAFGYLEAQPLPPAPPAETPDPLLD